MRTSRQCLLCNSGVNHSSPWITTHCLPDQFKFSISKYSMCTCNKVMPFPCLATQECKTTNNCPCHPFHHSCPVSAMAFMYCKYHGYRAGDKYERHYTHKGKREIGMTSSGKCI